jgi:hypothetical protein
MTHEPYRIRALHLAALWAYGVAVPVFSFVGGNRELLALREATSTDVVAFAVVLALVPPLAAAGYAWLASRVSRWIGEMVFLALLAAFSLPVALQVIERVELDPHVALVGVGAVTLAIVAAYRRLRAVRLFLAYSAVLALVGVIGFVHGAPTTTFEPAASRASTGSHTPVVFVVLDEFPLSSILTGTGQIDSLRYPSFAQLARDATWYRNATTVHEATRYAVPAILTGRMPRRDTLPVLADHPENLFTLLGDSGYRVSATESWTVLCPRAHCPRDRGSTPNRVRMLLTDISSVYARSTLSRVSLTESPGRVFPIAEAVNPRHLTRTAMFERFVGGFSRDDGGRRSLHFIHSLLPHETFEFLPSGHAYMPEPLNGLTQDTQEWSHDSWLVLQGYQRHLLQVGYVDTLIGRLLDRLRTEGLYEEALIVVVADHGASFVAGSNRRVIDHQNVADIANVPLFVKYPRQVRGHIDTRPARTIDVLPTVAGVLGIGVPWSVDGTSLRTRLPARTTVVVGRAHGSPLRSGITSIERRTRITATRKEAAFGVGWPSLFRIGTNRGLLGLRVRHAPTASETRVAIRDEALLARVRMEAHYLPVRVSGWVDTGSIAPGTELAIAVNGEIWALTRPFDVDGVQRFSALVPEASLREGFNRVEVFSITAGAAPGRLVRLGGNEKHPSP